MNSKYIIFSVLMIAVVGGVVLKAITANAANTQTAQVQQAPQKSQQGQHVGANGVQEQLLTDGPAEKARAEALKAVPGGTVLRVETDAEGAAYEAHMMRADGSYVTVKFDTNFAVTKTEDGPQMRKSNQL